MLRRDIVFFGQPSVLACDGGCDKAWGINGKRPRVNFDPNNVDDFAYLPDGEVGAAPKDPGTLEGGCGKPRSEGERLNKWCARECERSVLVRSGEAINLPDFSKRVYNLRRRRIEEASK